MGKLFELLKTIFGINVMKAENALESSIDQVDRINLAIKKENEQLAKSNVALKNTRKELLLIQKEIDDAFEAKETLEKKAFSMVENYRMQGLTDEQITEKISEISDEVTNDIERLDNIIESKKPVVESLRQSIKSFEEKIKEMEKTIKDNEMESSKIKTSIEIAKTGNMIAETNSSLNNSSSNAEIEKAKKLVNELEADTQAKLEQAEFQGTSERKLDKLLAESKKGQTKNNPFAKALETNKQKESLQIENTNINNNEDTKLLN
jgi:phage shock protein A